MGEKHVSKIGHYRDGYFRRNVQEISTASTRYEVPVNESGALYWLNTASSMNIILPRISSKWLGLTYEFALQEQASSDDVKLRCDIFDSSAIIQTAFSSVVDNHTTAIPNSTFMTGGRITAVSSIVWMLEQITGPAGTFGTTNADNAVGGWTTG